MSLKNNFVINTCLLTVAAQASFAVNAAVNSVSLEEIVVTAQRKEQSLQDVPIAVSAVTDSALKNAAITDTQSLAMTIPGLNFNQTAGAGVPVIRGIGSSNVVQGDESSVAIYVDGAYRPFRAGNVFSFNNIERVEVLKGPQGALFGRNATGGVIQVITKNPSQEFKADVSVGYDSYATSVVKAYMTNGLTDTLAADLAIFYSDQDEGWGENLSLNEDAYYNREFSARAKVLWTPTAATDVIFSLEKNSSYFNFGYRLMGSSVAFDGSVKPDDFYDIRSTYSPELDTDQLISSVTVEHDFGNVAFKSVTTYQELQGVQWLDNDVIALPILNARLDQAGRAITEEFQFSGAIADNIDWIAGVFLMSNESGHDSVQLSGAALGGDVLDTKAMQDTTTYSVFAQATLPLTEKLAVTAGVRYTVDEQELDYRISSNGGLVTQGKLDEEFSKTSPRVVVEYHVDDAVLVYASYNAGFKSGLFNTIEPLRPVVKPESLDAYEVGLKSEFLDNRVRLNLAGYYYDYSDFQVLQVVEAATVLLNAGKVKSYGIDADLEWAASENLTLHVGLALFDGEYDEFSGAPISTSNAPFPGSSIVGGDASGNDVTRAPEQQFILGGTYAVTSQLSLNLNYTHTSEFSWEADNRLQQDALNMVNATVNWQSGNEKFGVQLWGRNLLDEEYDVFATALPFGDIAQAGAPRTLGINIDYHF